MRVLIDECIDWRLSRELGEHDVKTALPDEIQIDVVAAVEQAIAHSGDGFPRHVRMLFAEGGGQPPGGFPDDEEIVKDGLLGHREGQLWLGPSVKSAPKAARGLGDEGLTRLPFLAA